MRFQKSGMYTVENELKQNLLHYLPKFRKVRNSWIILSRRIPELADGLSRFNRIRNRYHMPSTVYNNTGRVATQAPFQRPIDFCQHSCGIAPLPPQAQARFILLSLPGSENP